MSDGQYVMGTVLEITLCETDTTQGRQTIATLFATAAHLDALLSTFSPTSPVSRLNAQAGRGAQSVPPEVADLLALSLSYWRTTDRTFDITVGPLMALWRQAAATHTLPSPAVVRQTRSRLGSEKIKLLPHDRIALMRPGMAIDLGGIGKGYALDQLTHLLKKQGLSRALLDFGQSSIWALGTPPDAEGWHLLVQQPNGETADLITLHDEALSVSGSLGQTFVVNGNRYGHVIDPRSGEPLRRDLLACVIAPNATQAEALSKALLILGEHKGIALLQRFPGVEGLLVEAGGRRWLTPGWTAKEITDSRS
ncbi:MAG: FAD:protein FMN transferase [Deltaproteobacteria bacterium]|nr:FAD:protein FMN transferase [Deltaproteobacteria bacterium]